jgi:LysR family transcriptional regulator, transcriptional activator for bauABCD operon
MVPEINDVDLRLFRVFVAVVEAGGFAAAESVLDHAQSTISNYMAHLEARLGYRLCLRGRAGFVMTEEGEVAYRLIKRLLNQASDLASELAAQSGLLTGMLKLGLLDTVFSTRWASLESTIQRWTRRKSSAKLSVRVEDPRDMESMLIEGDLHIVIASFINKRSALDYQFIYSERHCLYASGDHPILALTTDEDVASNISHYPVVSRALWEKHDEKLACGAKVKAAIHSIEAKMLLISSGRYIGFLPVHYVDSHNMGSRVVALLPDKISWNAKYYIVTKRAVKLPIVSAFLEDLTASMNTEKADRLY